MFRMNIFKYVKMLKNDVSNIMKSIINHVRKRILYLNIVDAYKQQEEDLYKEIGEITKVFLFLEFF